LDFERRSRKSTEPNLTPLVDIILMLVIFFMLGTSFIVSESMELSLPSGKAAPTNSSEVMRVQVLQNGEVAVEQTLLPRATFNQLLVERIGENPHMKIAIFTTPGASVQQLVSILDEVYLSGGTNVQVDKIGGAVR
jgi:biopolymer transport protein ExbD